MWLRAVAPQVGSFGDFDTSVRICLDAKAEAEAEAEAGTMLGERTSRDAINPVGDTDAMRQDRGVV